MISKKYFWKKYLTVNVSYLLIMIVVTFHEDYLKNTGENHELTNFCYISNSHTNMFYKNIRSEKLPVRSVQLSEKGQFKKLINFSLDDSQNIGELFSGVKSLYNKCNFDINMALPKYQYKKYEPVIAKFELINNDSIPLEIYNLFDPELQETHIKITDNLGNTWSGNKIIFQTSVAHRPQYVINPGDTFTISMALNNWAERHEKNFMTDNDWYFNQYGYFPPGRKYKAYMYFNDNNIDVYGCELRSNDAEFEVIDLEEEDIQLLNKYIIKTNKYNYKALDKIIEEYPENIFTEYVTATYLLKKYWFLNSVNEYNSNDVEEEYDKFINKYPESMYLQNHRFMKAFFSYYRINNTTIAELKTKIKNNLVSKLTKWLY